MRIFCILFICIFQLKLFAQHVDQSDSSISFDKYHLLPNPVNSTSRLQEFGFENIRSIIANYTIDIYYPIAKNYLLSDSAIVIHELFINYNIDGFDSVNSVILNLKTKKTYAIDLAKDKITEIKIQQSLSDNSVPLDSLFKFKNSFGPFFNTTEDKRRIKEYVVDRVTVNSFTSFYIDLSGFQPNRTKIPINRHSKRYKIIETESVANMPIWHFLECIFDEYPSDFVYRKKD